MGITGLLPALKPVTFELHAKDLKGLSVGVDTYCWLHKAVYACSEELCEGTPTDKHIRFALHRLDMLLHFGARPYLVCDGDFLPAKGGKESERGSKRAESLAKAQQCKREGNLAAARAHYVKAVDVTPAMAARFLHAARSRPDVRVLVAPYEADAQLGFLCRARHVDVVITEDSDLLLFGCHRVLFKMDKEGSGQHVALSDVLLQRNDELDYRKQQAQGTAEEALLLTCVLSGCDYLPSVPGMGLKKAHRIATRYSDFDRALRAVRFEFGSGVPQGYERSVRRAMATFRHQRVFDPVARTVVHLTPLPAEHGLGDDLSFLGPPVSDAEACAIADGRMDPVTRQMFSPQELDPQQQSGVPRNPSLSGSNSSSNRSSSSSRQPLQQRNSNIPAQQQQQQQQQQQPSIKVAMQKSAAKASSSSGSSSGSSAKQTEGMWHGRWQALPTAAATANQQQQQQQQQRPQSTGKFGSKYSSISISDSSKGSRASAPGVLPRQKTLTNFFAATAATPAAKQQHSRSNSSGRKRRHTGNKGKAAPEPPSPATFYGVCSPSQGCSSTQSSDAAGADQQTVSVYDVDSDDMDVSATTAAADSSAANWLDSMAPISAPAAAAAGSAKAASSGSSSYSSDSTSVAAAAPAVAAATATASKHFGSSTGCVGGSNNSSSFARRNSSSSVKLRAFSPPGRSSTAPTSAESGSSSSAVPLKRRRTLGAAPTRTDRFIRSSVADFSTLACDEAVSDAGTYTAAAAAAAAGAVTVNPYWNAGSSSSSNRDVGSCASIAAAGDCSNPFYMDNEAADDDATNSTADKGPLHPATRSDIADGSLAQSIVSDPPRSEQHPAHIEGSTDNQQQMTENPCNTAAASAEAPSLYLNKLNDFIYTAPDSDAASVSPVLSSATAAAAAAVAAPASVGRRAAAASGKAAPSSKKSKRAPSSRSSSTKKKPPAAARRSATPRSGAASTGRKRVERWRQPVAAVTTAPLQQQQQQSEDAAGYASMFEKFVNPEEA